MTYNEKWSFDKEAPTWDQNPIRVQLASDIFKALSEESLVRSDMDALDFGCGTGLLTLQLAAVVRSVTGVDTSQGMLDVLKAKIKERGLTNVKVQYLDLEKGDAFDGSYDLIVCSMTLHHVREIKPLLARFHQLAAPGGRLCIIDLDPDDGQFHGNNDTVFHNGFNRSMLHDVLLEVGFNHVQARMAARVTRPASNGIMRSFDIFLMAAWKGHSREC